MAPTTQPPTTPPPATTAAPTGTTSTSVDVTPPATTAPPPTTDAPPATSAPADQIVTIGDLFFRPSSLNISVGQSVSFQNNGDLPHTSTSGTPSARSDLWHSGTLSSGESFVVTFDSAGTFSYFCAIHPNDMQATITVGGG